VVQSHPEVSDSIFTRAPGVRIRLLRLSQPHLEAFRIRVPPTLFAAPTIWEVILMAVLPLPIPFPEREAAVGAEAVSLGWNERDVILSGGSHDGI
jgi:hypothetical protein